MGGSQEEEVSKGMGRGSIIYPGLLQGLKNYLDVWDLIRRGPGGPRAFQDVTAYLN